MQASDLNIANTGSLEGLLALSQQSKTASIGSKYIYNELITKAVQNQNTDPELRQLLVNTYKGDGNGKFYKRVAPEGALNLSDALNKMRTKDGTMGSGFNSLVSDTALQHALAFEGGVASGINKLQSKVLWYKGNWGIMNENNRFVGGKKSLFGWILNKESPLYRKFMSHPIIQYLATKVRLQKLSMILQNWNENKAMNYWRQKSQLDKVKDRVRRVVKTGKPLMDNVNTLAAYIDTKFKNNPILKEAAKENKIINTAFGVGVYKPSPGVQKVYNAPQDIF